MKIDLSAKDYRETQINRLAKYGADCIGDWDNS